MKISVFGLGYVGLVASACLSKQGHKVTGVDLSEEKVNAVNNGCSPIIEKDLDEIISLSVEKNLLKATLIEDCDIVINKTEISLICVGTPSRKNGSLDIKYIKDVCYQIGKALAKIDFFHVVVVRSTMLPGTLKNHVIPILEKTSGKKCGVDFGLCNNPEFLRESTAVYDYFNPPKTVIGEMDTRSGNLVEKLYSDIDAPLCRVKIEVAEMIKYSDNVWHATKVVFANEIGNICKKVGIDSHEVMDVFIQDTKLNLSSYYLKPGFAFGGSCLPKDVRALTYKSAEINSITPLIDSLLVSNKGLVDRATNLIKIKEKKHIGIIGLSFKANTDDFRESPIIEVINTLIKDGYSVSVYDSNIKEVDLPVISRILSNNIETVINNSETIVIANLDPIISEIIPLLHDNHNVIDLVRTDKENEINCPYEGISW